MNIQDAVRQSIESFASVFPPETQNDLRLEEVSLSPDEEIWLTTVSFRNPDLSKDESSAPKPSSLAGLLAARPPSERTYKTIRLRVGDGRVLGISDPI